MDEDVGKFIFDFFRKRLLVKQITFIWKLFIEINMKVISNIQYESHLKYSI